MDSALELLMMATSRVYGKLRHPNESFDPPRKQMILLFVLGVSPVAISLLAAGVYLLASP